MEESEKFRTYVLFATENLPEFYLTQWFDKKIPPEHCGDDPFKEVGRSVLDKQIKIRAKDILYKG